MLLVKFDCSVIIGSKIIFVFSIGVALKLESTPKLGFWGISCMKVEICIFLYLRRHPWRENTRFDVLIAQIGQQL